MKLFFYLLFGGTAFILLLKIILKKARFYGFYYLAYYTEIDAIDFLRYLEDKDLPALSILISRKLAEKNLLADYKAIVLMRRLSKARIFSETMAREIEENIQLKINQTSIKSAVFNDIHFYSFHLRFKGVFDNFEAAKAYEDWWLFLKERRKLRMALKLLAFCLKDTCGVNYNSIELK